MELTLFFFSWVFCLVFFLVFFGRKKAGPKKWLPAFDLPRDGRKKNMLECAVLLKKTFIQLLFYFLFCFFLSKTLKKRGKTKNKNKIDCDCTRSRFFLPLRLLKTQNNKISWLQPPPFFSFVVKKKKNLQWTLKALI